jgi:hypothetical protein
LRSCISASGAISNISLHTGSLSDGILLILVSRVFAEFYLFC